MRDHEHAQLAAVDVLDAQVQDQIDQWRANVLALVLTSEGKGVSSKDVGFYQVYVELFGLPYPGSAPHHPMTGQSVYWAAYQVRQGQ